MIVDQSKDAPLLALVERFFETDSELFTFDDVGGRSVDTRTLKLKVLRTISKLAQVLEQIELIESVD